MFCRGAMFIISVLVLIPDFSVCENMYSPDNSISQMGHGDMTNTHLTRIMEMLTSLDERLNSLDARVAALSSGPQPDSNRQVVQDLRGLCSALDLNGASGTQSTSSPSPVTPSPDVPFRVTRVSKEDKGDFFKVRLEYIASSAPKAILLWLANDRAFKVLEGQDFGAVEVEVPKLEIQDGPGPDSMSILAALQFVFPGHAHTALLQLRDTPDTMQVPPVKFDVAQGNDVTFAPGSDVELDFTLEIEGDAEAVGREHVRFHLYVKNDTEENIIDQLHTVSGGSLDTIWAKLENSEEPGSGNGRLRVGSNAGDPEGIVDFVVDLSFNCSVNCLLMQLSSQVSVRLHREDHQGPFPDDFLGFIREDVSGDPSTVYCGLSTEGEPSDCLIPCQVGGSEPSTAEISRVLPNGDVMPTNDVTLSADWWGRAMLILPHVFLTDAGQYRCTGRSGSRVISRDITLEVIERPAKIDKASSGIRELENGSLAAVCIAEGIPAPNVTFQTAYTSLAHVSPEAYVITVTKLNETTTRAEVVVFDEASSVYNVECVANNAGSGFRFSQFSDHHYMTRSEGTDMYY